MHQDLISRYFCGEGTSSPWHLLLVCYLLSCFNQTRASHFVTLGMPDWAVPTPSEHFPAPLAWLNLSFEANNYPTLESCLQVSSFCLNRRLSL
jgi:hypothetical protein